MRRTPGARARVGRPARGGAARRDRRDAAPGAVRLAARARRPRRDRRARYLLTSVERFRDPERNPLGEEIREDLLARLGLYRGAPGGPAHRRRRGADARPSCRARCWSIPGSASSAARARRGVRRAGALLKARSALVALRAIGDGARTARAWPGPRDVVEAIDRLEASSRALALLRLQHLVLAGLARAAARRASGDRTAVRRGARRERVGLGRTARPRTRSGPRPSPASNGGARGPATR